MTSHAEACKSADPLGRLVFAVIGLVTTRCSLGKEIADIRFPANFPVTG